MAAKLYYYTEDSSAQHKIRNAESMMHDALTGQLCDGRAAARACCPFLLCAMLPWQRKHSAVQTAARIRPTLNMVEYNNNKQLMGWVKPSKMATSSTGTVLLTSACHLLQLPTTLQQATLCPS